MTETVSMRGLGDWLHGELSSPADGETAVLAGHFALFSSGAAAMDLLESPKPPAGASEMIAFTKATWHAACDAIANRAVQPQVRLMVLADDIQYVRPALDDRGASERLGAALAAGYFRAHAGLPAFHEGALGARRIGEDRVLRHSSTRALFSERELRIAAVERLRARARSHDAPSVGLTASESGTRIDVTLPDRDPYCLVHSGRTNCAGGYLELLTQLAERGVRRLVALVPYRCLGQVTVGATLARRLFGVRELEVVTVAVPDVATDVAAAVVRDRVTSVS